MKDVLKKRKGFTLVELLIAITILGILMAIAIPALTNISKKDIDTQERIYEDALVTAAKMYNDSYQEDTFGKKKYGCAKIGYSKLKDKDLIKKLESNKLNCAYQEEGKDTSGLIVRKIENKYYYETVMWCINKATGKKEKAAGNTDDKFYEIPDSYCSETATDDSEPPVLYYTNNNKRYYYNATNLPKPKVWINDAVSGLKEGNQTINIEWKDLAGNNIITNRSGKKTYTISRRGINLSPQTITLIDEIKAENGNGKYQLTITSINIEDGAGHTLEGNTKATVEQPKVNPSGVSKEVKHPDIFYVENTTPKITTSADKGWTNQAYTVTFSVTDEDTTTGSRVYSGIKKFTKKVVNTSTNQTIDNNVDCGEVSTEGQINGAQNAAQKAKSCSIAIGTGNYKDGVYTVTTKAEDWAGNSATTSNTYKYDGTAPEVGITRKAYNQYEWTARDTGYSNLNGYINDKSAANPTSGWTNINPTVTTKTGTVTITTAGTYYTHVRDAAGNQAKANIAAHAVTRSEGAGTTLTTKYETATGTAFTNNPVVLNGTPINIAGRLNAGYENLEIKYGNTTISTGNTKTVTGNVTISTTATKCRVGKWNDGTHATCQNCPTGYTSDEGATSENMCYINVEAAKYKTTATGTTTTACAIGYYKEAHKSYYNSTDACTQCPAGYRNGGAASSQTGCKRDVAAGKYIKNAKDTSDTGCGTGYYKGEHQVNYGSTSSCSHCPAGYRNGAAASSQTGCKRDVAAGKYIKNAKDTSDTGCGTGYYKGAHQVKYGDTSSCSHCPAGYRNGAAASAQTGCKRDVAAGKYIKNAKDTSDTGCETGYYKGAHQVKYGDTSSCTHCPSGYRDGGAATSQSGCKKSVSCGYHVGTANGGVSKCSAGTYKEAHKVNYGSTSSCSGCGSGKTSNAGSCSSSDCRASTTRIRLCRRGNTCINCTYSCHYVEPFGTEFNAVSAGDWWKIKGGFYDGCTIAKNCVGATECSAAQCPDI